MSFCAFSTPAHGPCPREAEVEDYCFWHSKAYKDELELKELEVAAKQYPYGLHLLGIRFEDTKFGPLSLAQTRIVHGSFDHCVFEDLIFDGAWLDRCSFLNCEFKNCSFEGTHLSHTTLKACSLEGCRAIELTAQRGEWDTLKFRSSVMAGSRFQGLHLLRVDFSDVAFCTEESIARRSYTDWSHVHVVQCVLAGLELNFMVLSACSLFRSQFLDCCFRRSFLHQSRFVDCEFDGSYDLSQDNFDQCELNLATHESLSRIIENLSLGPLPDGSSI